MAEAEREFSVLLVVDDDALVRTFLRDQLEALGHTVLTACDAEEAGTLLRLVAEPVVVVLDLLLPGRTGVEMLAELHPLSARYLRVVLVSASARVQQAAAHHPLVVGRLEKPIDMTQLMQHVHAAQTQLGMAAA
ncbi:MAG: response regulator [Myxococcaceae bacterium]